MMDPLESVMWLAILSVIFFCLCCYQLMKVLLRPVPALNRSDFAKSALRVAKAYKVFAWGTLTSTFLVGLVISFIDVFTQL